MANKSKVYDLCFVGGMGIKTINKARLSYG